MFTQFSFVIKVPTDKLTFLLTSYTSGLGKDYQLLHEYRGEELEQRGENLACESVTSHSHKLFGYLKDNTTQQ